MACETYSLFDAYVYLPFFLTENMYLQPGKNVNESTNMKLLKCQKLQSRKLMSTALSVICVLCSRPH